MDKIDLSEIDVGKVGVPVKSVAAFVYSLSYAVCQTFPSGQGEGRRVELHRHLRLHMDRHFHKCSDLSDEEKESLHRMDVALDVQLRRRSRDGS